jgi:phosphoserine phosphatase RsbU/P
MISEKYIVRISAIFAACCWIIALAINIAVIFSYLNNVPHGIPDEAQSIFLSLFFIFILIFYEYNIGKADKINFIDLLWKVFVTGLIATIVSLLIQFFFFILGGRRFAENVLLINFLYHINFGIIVAFLISTFISWKRLILYNKSKILVKGWRVFEYAVIGSIILNFFDYNRYNTVLSIILTILVGMGIILSVNLKWVAYLNFRQKWKSILLIILINFYLVYFIFVLINFSQATQLVVDLLDKVFILSLFSFIFIYAVFSLLVVLFNLPTSSVFEQKLEEVINFQRLSQSMQTTQNEELVLDILLESSVSTVLADAAWIELNTKDEPLFLRSNVTKEEIYEVKEWLEITRSKKITDGGVEKIIHTNKPKFSLRKKKYKSSLTYPLKVQNEEIGSMVLLKEVGEAFNKEMRDIISTFVTQACISIENYRLLSEAIVNERYKEELSIAKKVQLSLLPQKLDYNYNYEISAFSMSADEVGGDYYDVFPINEEKVAFIIGDVSGKGTSAAFNMSQMKGVFHSLVQLDLDPESFLYNANSALSRCLEKTSFITVSYFVVNFSNKSIEFARAGHCPTLYFDNKSKEGKYFVTKGLGLGIKRNDAYKSFIEVNKFIFSEGDVIVLYTDGIIEAKNEDQEDYGYEKLKDVIENNNSKSAEGIKDEIVKSLYSHCGEIPLNDDYTLLIVKFK